MNKIYLYNSLTKKKEELKTIKKGEIGLYTCGPTVYNYAHIGNLRTYIFEDILKRVLLYNGYKVKHIMNITDVGHLTGDMDMGEDKLEKGAKREGTTAWDVAKKYEQAFKDDIEKLNILPPTKYTRATKYIDEQISLIKTLEKKNYTYKTSDGVYFDTSKFKNYNKLSHLKLDELQEGARVEKNEEKKNPTDFALWKFSIPHPNPLLAKERGQKERRQMEWWFEGKNKGKLVSKTEINDDKSKDTIGFPGWHLECSAMSMAELGDQLDIHCGGIDHINVHHTNEIAQSEAATDKKFFNYWMHGAFLNIQGGKKMAKSESNFLTLENAFSKKGIDPLVYRFASLQTHYRKPMEYSDKAMRNAKKGLEHLYNQVRSLGINKSKIKNQKSKCNKKFKDNFINAVNDDLNMPKALAVTEEMLKFNISNEEKYFTVLDFDKILGLDLKEVLELSISASPSPAPDEDWSEWENEIRKKYPSEIEKLIINREKARKEKNWTESDRLREKIEKKGYILKDKKEGIEIIKK